MRTGLALWGALVLLVSSCDKSESVSAKSGSVSTNSEWVSNTSEPVTREDCGKVADHISAIIMDHYISHPDELWDGLRAGSGDTGVPATVTRETFKAFLDSPAGKTWIVARHGQVRTATEASIEPCVQRASRPLVRCLLAAKTREDVPACDKAHPPPASSK